MIDLCSDIENKLRYRSHQPAGPIYKNLRKRHALMYFKEKNDLNAIYSLSESHAPTYRIKTMYRYGRILTEPSTQLLTMKKEHVQFSCPDLFNSEVKAMLDKVCEMPKEWTLVQLTSKLNLSENTRTDLTKLSTDSLHLSVFNCGQSVQIPFCLHINAPVDSSGDNIELAQEMWAIVNENKNLLYNCFGTNSRDLVYDKITNKQRQTYHESRIGIDHRLQNMIKELENWLGEWKCLLIGKFLDEKSASLIYDRVDSVLKKCDFNPTKKIEYILHRIIAGAEYLSTTEISKAVKYCIPDRKDLRIKIIKIIQEIANGFKFNKMKRLPVILIVDERIDFFPWEMINILTDHPISRMPSLHFAYGLYKEHESTMENGYKLVKTTNGSYILNPGLDLKRMEARLKEFFQYWMPTWKGMVGKTPSSDEFIEFITSGDIFVYNGHGSGTQFLAANKIQQMRIESVVLLFGCSSVRMNHMGPFVEMYDVFHNYLIACSFLLVLYFLARPKYKTIHYLYNIKYRKQNVKNENHLAHVTFVLQSPCVVGMLWEVTDFDTDILSTGILSLWIPSKAESHWKIIDKMKWDKQNIISVSTELVKQKSGEPDHEPELLRAISIARHGPSQFLTKSAIVARGLPIKIVT